MKATATALVAAAALVCGTAAFAQQDRHDTNRGEESARADQQDHGRASDKMSNGAHRLGNKMRSAMHRMGDKMHAHRDTHHDTLHASRDARHDNDTRAMGAPGRDTEHDRQARMDDAYSHWHARHGDRDTTTTR